MIEELIPTKSEIVTAKRNPKAVILTALPEEYQAIKEHLPDTFEVEHPSGNIYEQGVFNGENQTWDVLIGEVGIGNPNSALGAERAISFFHPDVIIFVGIAGGIKDVKLGDIVVADKAYGYESAKTKKRNITLARPDLGKSSFRILERAKMEARKKDWKGRIKNSENNDDVCVIIKPIASGEKVVTSEQGVICKQIKKVFSDAVAVEMEAVGFFSATQMNSRIEALIVRGISDLLDNKEEADKAGIRIMALKNASAFAFQVLFKFKQLVDL